MSRATKYRLAFSAPGAVNDEAPYSGDFQTLAGALTAGWASEASGSRVLRVTYRGLPVMSEDDLSRAFELLRAIESECPGDNRINCAERVLREMGLE